MSGGARQAKGGTSEEDISLRELEEDGTETEKKALVDRQEDGEEYSVRNCLKARSFNFALTISFIVVFLVFLLTILVIITLVILGPPPTPPQRRTLTLDDVLDPDYQHKTYNGTWTPDNRLLQTSLQSGVTLLNPSVMTTEQESIETLIDPGRWGTLNEELGSISNVKLSYDNQYILLIARKEKVYRHSYLADYYLYHNGIVTNVTKPENVNESARIQFAEWSPTANIIVYVLGYNIYLLDVASANVTTVTTDGRENEVSNGIPDWVYEEEVLSSNSALWWSPDGSRILYTSFNDEQVRDFSFPYYGSPFNQYTDIRSIAYPKPGTPNPVVGLHVVSVDDVSSVTSLNPSSDIDSDNYFLFAGWASNSTPYVTWMNRTQTSAVYCTYALPSSQCERVYVQTSAAWIEGTDGPRFLDEGTRFITLVSRSVGDDGFTHIVEVETTGTGGNRFLTDGMWDVTSILGTNGSDTLYLSTKSSPRDRHVYSDSLEFCVLMCKGPAVPYSLLVRYTEGKFIPVKYLENNTVLHERISDMELPTAEAFEVPSSADGPSLNGRLILPPFFKDSNKYPVLFYVYGGPNSQVADNQFILNSLGRMYLVSDLNMILASVDGRGSGFRGDNFKHEVYKNLGYYETIDQIRGGRYLQGFQYVDSSKLAIYGSSYGGYMGAMVGSSGSGVYRAAISQSPVTDWRYYDSIYTERYMGQPTDEGNTYEESSVLPRAGNISSIDFLLIHGTADDNVHFQQSAQLIEALVNHNVHFQLQIYTDKTHALTGDVITRHLYELLAGFLRQSFQLG